MTQAKVLVVYPFLHHYRQGVFREMDKTEGIQYTFISDTEGAKGVKSLPSDAVANHLLTPRKQFKSLSWQIGLIPILIKRDYDAIIFLAEIPSVSTWIGAAISRLRKKPVLFWTIGWHRPEQGLKRILRNLFFKLSDQLLLYGELGKSIGKQMKFPAERMTVIGNSVEAASSAPREKEYWNFVKPPRTMVIGAVIRLIPVKNLELVIRAAAQLAKDEQQLKVRVLLVGEGPERDSLQRLANELDVDLDLPGAFYDSTTLKAIYDVLDVTVVPAAVGLTAIQSMSYGVPVVSNDSAYTQMPEWESIKPGETGELFKDGDVQGLAEAIRRITSRSSKEREEIFRNCKNEVEKNWTAKAHAAKISDSITEILRNR